MSGGAGGAWARARRLLLVRLDNLGDVLMSTPAFAAVRESLPGAHLTLLGSPAGAALAPHLAMIDEAIAFEAPWVKPAAQAPGAGALGAAERELIERLAAVRFDAAIIFTVCTQSALPAALLCRLAGIPLRLAHARENPYGLLSDWRPETDVLRSGMRHEVQRQLDLVASVGLRTADDRLRFELRPADSARAQALLRERGVAPGQPYLLVHPGATAESRRYPAELFGTAAGLLARDEGCRVLFTGGPAEASLIESARRAMGSDDSISLAGQLSLGELAALIAGARVLLSNNSGPVHIAAAVGTPVVDLYALTNPQHTPWRVPARVLNHDVPCRNCQKSVCLHGHHDCLRKVAPSEVAAAARELMGAGA